MGFFFSHTLPFLSTFLSRSSFLSFISVFFSHTLFSISFYFFLLFSLSVPLFLFLYLLFVTAFTAIKTLQLHTFEPIKNKVTSNNRTWTNLLVAVCFQSQAFCHDFSISICACREVGMYFSQLRWSLFPSSYQVYAFLTFLIYIVCFLPTSYRLRFLIQIISSIFLISREDTSKLILFNFSHRLKFKNNILFWVHWKFQIITY